MRLIPLAILSAALIGCLAVQVKENIKYDRDEWLPRRSDTDKDCQNTRHELLIQFILAPVRFTNEKKCTVKTGLWLDLYTGNFYKLAFDLDVEHIVPLLWTHTYGGTAWTTELKRQFAEDPENLWLVDDGRNQSKGDRGPGEWMPPYKQVQAIYVQRFMAVIEKHGLSATKEKMQRYIATIKSRVAKQ